MRKKKTPEELAAEAEQEELDDFTSKLNNFHANCRPTNKQKGNLIPKQNVIKHQR